MGRIENKPGLVCYQVDECRLLSAISDRRGIHLHFPDLGVGDRPFLDHECNDREESLYLVVPYLDQDMLLCILLNDDTAVVL